MKEQIIMYDSPEAATIKTVTGWVSSNGRFWGDNEHLARYDGSTHKKCDKNPNHPPVRTRGYCEFCREENRNNDFISYQSKLWDGKSPIAIFDSEEYFFSIDDLFDYLCDNEIQIREVKFVHCKPSYPTQIDPNELYEDDLPEGGEVSAELQDAFYALNEVIKKQGPLSWWQDKFKVEFSKDQLDSFDQCYKETQDATEAWENKYNTNKK